MLVDADNRPVTLTLAQAHARAKKLGEGWPLPNLGDQGFIMSRVTHPKWTNCVFHFHNVGDYQTPNRIAGWILSMLMLAGGIALMGVGVDFTHQANQAKSWAQTPGQITRVSVRSVRGSSGTSRTYEIRLDYRYEVQGSIFRSQRFRLGDGSNAGSYSKQSEAQKASKLWSRGQAVDVFYDPADPSSAVLRTDLSWGVYVPLVLGAVFIMAGLLFIGNLRRGS